MKAAFLAGVLLGIAGVLAAAKHVPRIDPPRLPSLTSVVANGGRAERFQIRLPADRIAAQGGTGTGLRGTASPSGAGLPEPLGSSAFLGEQFKLRDRDDNVIGVAARHWTEVDGEPVAAWLLVIPSRGALLLTADGEAAGAADRVLRAAGYRAGEAWAGEAGATLVGNERPGRVRDGSGEFNGLEGRFTETWNLTGVGASGEIRGTIELETLTRDRT